MTRVKSEEKRIMNNLLDNRNILYSNLDKIRRDYIRKIIIDMNKGEVTIDIENLITDLIIELYNWIDLSGGWHKSIFLIWSLYDQGKKLSLINKTFFEIIREGRETETSIYKVVVSL